MAQAPQPSQRPPQHPTDPFQDVDAKSVTDIEMDAKVTLAREPEALPAAARLTDLPLKWVILALILCIGISELAQRVERRHLIEKAVETGLIEEADAQKARDTNDVADQRDRIQQRMRELKERRQKFDEIGKPKPGYKPSPPSSRPGPKQAEPETDEIAGIPITLEALRAEIRRISGDSFEAHRQLATLAALLAGAFGLILMAIFARLLAAAMVGGLAFGICYFVQVEAWVLWVSTAAGAVLGAWLAPRLLLANMLFNVSLAGMVLGGALVGGGVYLATLNELYAIFGLGGGLVLGAVIGFKFYRQLFLTAVLVNSAWSATLLLWLLWGDLFPHFWPVTFGGLMIMDGVATRIYHKVRWSTV